MSTVPDICSMECREARSIGEHETATLSKVRKEWNQSAFTLLPGGIKTSFRSLKDPPGTGPPLIK